MGGVCEYPVCLLSSRQDLLTPSIVSEYVPKGNLRSFMLGRRPFPWRLRLSFATDIARAIAYLHARDVSSPLFVVRREDVADA
jgi:serine/threonine protein kinase